MNKNYKNLVFTDHAINRLSKRKLTQHSIYQTIKNPEEDWEHDDGSTKFIKTINGRKIHVVANYLKKERNWLIISVWVRGEEDQLPLTWRIITWPFRIIWKIFLKIID